jgi:predicted membrane protein
METKDENSERFMRRGMGRALPGIVLVTVGAVLLGREMGLDIPHWVLTWEMLLIGLGLFFGARRMFRPGAWMILILIGSAFILSEYADVSLSHYIWPVAIIASGLYMILRPKRARREWTFAESVSGDDYIDANSVFGGTKRKVMSKEFKGGSINSVFGGNDIDFMQADINGSAVLDVNVAFGGVKLLVPNHWKVQSDVDCVFGAVEDKRRDASNVSDKTLVIKGSVVFGGIEIKSY